MPPAGESRSVRGGSQVTTLAYGGGISFAGRIASRMLALLTQVALARGLGPATFGLYALGATLLRFATLVGTAGLDKGVVRYGTPLFGTDADELGGVLGRTATVAAVLGLVLGALLWLLAEPLAAQLFGKPELATIAKWFAAVIPLAVLLRVFAAATRISKRMAFGVWAEDLVQPGVQLALVLLLLSLGWALRGALTAITASYSLAFAICALFLTRLFPGLVPPRLRSRLGWGELLSFSLQSLMAATFTVLILVADRLFLGFFRPAEEVGMYHVASQLALLLPLISGSFASIVAPLFAEAHQRPDRIHRIGVIYRTTIRWSASLTLPSFLILTFCGRPVIELTFGTAYAGAWLPLALLASGQMVNVVTGPVGLLLLMTGQQWLWFKISGIMFVLGLLLNLVLIPRFGALGAAVGTAITVGGLFVSGLWGVRRHFGFSLIGQRGYRFALAAALATVAVALAARLPTPGPLLAVAASAAAATVAFYPALLWKGLDHEERAILRTVLGRLGLRRDAPGEADGDRSSELES